MTRPLAKYLLVLMALGLWNLAGPTSLAEDDDPNGLRQLIEQGRYQEATPIAERVVEVAKRIRGSEDPETADALHSLGLVFEKIGEYAKAEPLFQEALRIRRKAFGPENPLTAQSLNNLAWLYQAMGEYAKAEPLYQEALRVRQKVLGTENPETAQSFNSLWPGCIGKWASTLKPSRSIRKRCGFVRRFLGRNIPLRRRASTNWPSCTGNGRVH
jgi:tetratricopeptide (TPR) repeat protein